MNAAGRYFLVGQGNWHVYKDRWQDKIIGLCGYRTNRPAAFLVAEETPIDFCRSCKRISKFH